MAIRVEDHSTIGDSLMIDLFWPRPTAGTGPRRRNRTLALTNADAAAQDALERARRYQWDRVLKPRERRLNYPDLYLLGTRSARPGPAVRERSRAHVQ